MAKPTTLTLRASEEVKQALERAAEALERSQSWYIERALTLRLIEDGYLPKKKAK